MKPTIEEVKKVAIECGADTFGSHDRYISVSVCGHTIFTDEQLQAFAQLYIMVGRKIESDLMVEAAIRNNTGE